MHAVSKNIKRLRLQRNLTQEEMADKLYVTRQTVSNWETGKSQPDIDMLVKIADILGTDTTALIYGIPESTHRKKDKIRLIILASVLLMLGVGAYFVGQYARDEAQRYYIGAPLMLSRMLLLPLFWFLLGVVIAQCLNFWGIIKPISAKIRKVLRIAMLSIVLLYLAIVIPFLIGMVDCWIQSKAAQLTESSFSYSWSYPLSILNDILFAVSQLVGEQPFIFVIPGLVYSLFKPIKKQNDMSA